MNEIEKRIADKILGEIEKATVTERDILLNQYEKILGCSNLRKSAEFYSNFPNGLPAAGITSMTATGVTAQPESAQAQPNH